MVTLLIALIAPISVGDPARIVAYECEEYPEAVGWERIQFLDCDRTLEYGWFIHYCDLGGTPGPLGERDLYRLSLADFAGASTFFIEWRVQTDVPSALFDESGIATALSSSGTSGTNYHFTLTEDRVRLFRDTFLPMIFVDMEAEVPHTYRLELDAAELYVWYMDGQMAAFGLPEGAYPADSSFLIWGTSHNVYENTARWDYIRYGVIPEDGSADYDSDGFASLDDFYFVHECLANDRPGIKGGPGNDAGPGCRFADFDSDGDTDLFDFAEFQDLFGTAHP